MYRAKGEVDNFSEEKERYLKLTLEEKRSEYACKSKFTTLNDIPPWSQYAKKLNANLSKSTALKDVLPWSQYVSYKNSKLNKKVSVFVGDITTLEIDAIVNATANPLRGRAGVDKAIHEAAGPMLFKECESLNGCDTGNAKITGGYKLPAKYVIHTVGPVGEDTELLTDCYERCLRLAKENNVRTIAFPCISTGIRSYPHETAAHVAIGTVRKFLEENESFERRKRFKNLWKRLIHRSCVSEFDRIIFCLFLPVDIAIYERLMQVYFPV